MALIVVVGAADTGRAPIAAALLQRLLGGQIPGTQVESAGVLGHDGDPAEIEARDTMLHMGLDISEHRARTVDDDLAAHAALLLAIDRGTALVLRGRFPDANSRIATLGELAGRRRDVPDPFRMQIGAWMTYARELEELLRAALPVITSRIGAAAPTLTPAAASLPHPSVTGERSAAAGRVAQLVQLAIEMPEVVDWGAARSRIDADLMLIASAPAGPADLIAAYIGLLRAAFAMLPNPSVRQLAALQPATAHLADPVDQTVLNEFSSVLPTLPTLT